MTFSVASSSGQRESWPRKGLIHWRPWSTIGLEKGQLLSLTPTHFIWALHGLWRRTGRTVEHLASDISNFYKNATGFFIVYLCLDRTTWKTSRWEHIPETCQGVPLLSPSLGEMMADSAHFLMPLKGSELLPKNQHVISITNFLVQSCFLRIHSPEGYLWSGSLKWEKS